MFQSHRVWVKARSFSPKPPKKESQYIPKHINSRKIHMFSWNRSTLALVSMCILVTSFQSSWLLIVNTSILSKWVFPKIGVPQIGWFIMENHIKMNDLGVTPIFGNIQMLQKKLIPSAGPRCHGVQLQAELESSEVPCSAYLTPPRIAVWRCAQLHSLEWERQNT